MSAEPKTPESEVVSAWDAIADAYQERYEIGHDRLHFGPMCPDDSELGIVGDVAGLRVLELGCGAGQNALFCARAGAARVLGVDPSERQIAIARRAAALAGAPAEFIRGDSRVCADHPSAFDLALSVYALMYVEDLEAALRHAREALAPGGRMVISVDHPFRLSGSWDETGRFAVENYFRAGWEAWDYDFPERALRARMHRRRRTVSGWLMSFMNAGFRLDGVAEPTPPEEPDTFGTRSKHGDRSPRNVFTRDKLERVPGTLIFWGSRR